MKKRVFAILLASVMIVGLVACGKEETPAAPSDHASTEISTDETTDEAPVGAGMTVAEANEYIMQLMNTLEEARQAVSSNDGDVEAVVAEYNAMSETATDVYNKIIEKDDVWPAECSEAVVYVETMALCLNQYAEFMMEGLPENDQDALANATAAYETYDREYAAALELVQE